MREKPCDSYKTSRSGRSSRSFPRAQGGNRPLEVLVCPFSHEFHTLAEGLRAEALFDSAAWGCKGRHSLARVLRRSQR